MIELAPNHKIGLAIHSPLMPAAGFFGYGANPYRPLIQTQQFGALVTNPITLRPRQPPPPPPALEVTGGVIFPAPPGNPGVKKIIRRYQKTWRKTPVPVIAHLPADDPDDLARTAGALDSLNVLAGFELGLPRQITAIEAQTCMRAILRRSELPLLVRLPYPPEPELVAAVAGAGTGALVLGTAPLAAAFNPQGEYVPGDLYGPGAAARCLPALVDLRRRFPHLPLIAGGGVHSPADAQAYLQAGAIAGQFDSLIFTHPARVQQILGRCIDSPPGL
ncbi:MAG: hypothetical protein ACE5G8_06535 [Anaerolineae bacterium]